MLHPALGLGEGLGDVTAGTDVGNEDDEDPGTDEGEDKAEAGGPEEEDVGRRVGVIESPPVGATAEEAPLEADLLLVAALEADVPSVPWMVNSGLWLPESPNSTTM